MSVGVWDPGGKATTITVKELSTLLVAIESANFDDLAASLPETVVQSGGRWMKHEAEAFKAAADLDNNQLELLIRFFTLAEMQLANWEAGKTNPVIYLVKELKQREAFYPELRKWIKANTDNRFLPNGAALGL